MEGQKKLVFAVVHGIVQGVMFRQTFLRACYKRGIAGGATNHPEDIHRVDLSMAGDAAKIQEILDKMASGDKLNSNLARVEKLEIVEDGLLPYEHEANTKSVKCDNEIPGINFYL